MKNVLLVLCLLSFLVACQEPPKAENKEAVTQEAPPLTDTATQSTTEVKADMTDVKTAATTAVPVTQSTPSPSKQEISNVSKAKPDVKTDIKKPVTPPAAVVKAPTFEEVKPILQKYTCMVCHAADKKMVGPAYKDVAKRGYSNEKIVQLIAKPEPSNWPTYPPMAALPQVPKGDALKMAAWINSL